MLIYAYIYENYLHNKTFDTPMIRGKLISDISFLIFSLPAVIVTNRNKKLSANHGGVCYTDY